MFYRWLLIYIVSCIGFSTCIDPFEPRYQNVQSFVIIRGEIIDQPGETEVSISESTLLLGSYIARNISDATVTIQDDDGNLSTLHAMEKLPGIYRPEPNFAGMEGKKYQLHVELRDGRKYQSEFEQMAAGIPVDSVYATFEPEMEFNDLRNEFVPGHRIMIDWQDPPDQVNFYQWRYTVFREEIICASCMGGVYRGNGCETRPSLPISNRFDYLCADPCWSINTHKTLNTFSDEFADGQLIRAKPVADLIFESRRSLLIEVSQYVISARQFKFNKLSADLALGSGGLNAVLPGAIIGNIINMEDPEEHVPGYFGAIPRRDKRIFLNRTSTEGTPTGEGIIPQLEPPNPGEDIPRSPCEESPFRTAIKPEGWP